MKVKVSELTGKGLDFAVAMCEGGTNFRFDTIATYWITIDGKDRALSTGWAQSFAPSTNWEHGGPIIDSIDGILLKNWLDSNPESKYQAEIHNYDGDWVAFGSTPLIAAMRCYVSSKVGDVVDIPNELLK